jgi:hypothetical protein
MDSRANSTYRLAQDRAEGIVLGVSQTNPRLHVFGTATYPDKPLFMDQRAWSALRKATSPSEVTVIACEDHGSERETTVHVHWNANGIDGTSREYTCPPDVRRLLGETPLPE